MTYSYECTKIFCSTDVKRKEAVNAANELSNALVEHLNVGYEKITVFSLVVHSN